MGPDKPKPSMMSAHMTAAKMVHRAMMQKALQRALPAKPKDKPHGKP